MEAIQLPERPDQPGEPAGTREWMAIVLLALGASIFAWVAAIVLIWLSSAWTLRDKQIATLVMPVGMLVYLLSPGLTDLSLKTVFLCVVLLSIIPAVYLAVRLRRY